MTFRRSGSFVRFFADGDGIDPESPDFLKLLRKRRFKSIESETTEVESIGWVSPADPSGSKIEAQEVARGRCVFLKMRMDRKVVPAVWMRIKLSELERAEMATGKRITRTMRREFKEAIAQELLASTLPAVSLIDVVWSLDRGQVYLFGTSHRAQEGFLSLWVRTFGGDAPAPVGPETLVANARLSGAARNAWANLTPLDLSGDRS